MPISNSDLQENITSLKGVGEIFAKKLSKLNIFNVGDLLHFLPNRYLDFSHKLKIKDLKAKRSAAIIANINSVSSFYTKSGKFITKAMATDESGSISLNWFSNPYIKRLINEGQDYTIAGTVSLFAGQKTFISPTIELGNSFSVNTSGFVPIFPQTKGVTSKWLRQKMYSVIDDLKLSDPLSENLLEELNLIDINSSYSQIHFPVDKKQKLQADKRLSFNQHLYINLSNLKSLQKLGKSPKIILDQNLHTKGLEKLPFTLTDDQQKTVKELFKDLGTDNYTHRLIQGDTGSGKTATLILAANQCLSQGFSCALIAPTQILASQHFESFKNLSLMPDNISLILGNHQEKIDIDMPMLYIGTHALLSKLPEKLNFPLAFLSIDEQHKFGVEQREQLQNRKPLPHLINLSATPIPRTVALGLLGDIKLSNIRFKPQNRLPVKTFVTPQSYFQKSTTWLTKELNEGNQIFIVCPHIHDAKTGTSSVEKIAEHYQKLLPKKTPLYILHGKLKNTEQNKIIESFKKSKGTVLVSTSLIEVGIDIPTANIMVIHSAERFGLAQLHQLRGRVGRGDSQGYCFLVPTTDDQVETERLKLLQKYSSGLTLAKKDLILRGAGEIFGQKQHGALQTKLKYFWSKKSFLKAKMVAKQLLEQNPSQAEAIATNLLAC